MAGEHTWLEEQCSAEQGFPLVQNVAKDAVEKGSIKGPLQGHVVGAINTDI